MSACSGPWTLNRNDGPVPINVADAALSAGLYGMAINVSNAILTRYPRDTAALATKGDALLGNGDVAGAEQTYRSLLAIDPGSVRATIGLGRVKLLSDPAAAEAEFLTALQRDPRNVIALNDLGVARDLQGRHADAQQAYRQVLGVAPDNVGAQVNLGLSLALSGRPADAVRVLQPLADMPGTSDRIRGDLALAKSLSGGTEAQRAPTEQESGVTPAGIPAGAVAQAASPTWQPAGSGTAAPAHPGTARVATAVGGSTSATPEHSAPSPATTAPATETRQAAGEARVSGPPHTITETPLPAPASLAGRPPVAAAPPAQSPASTTEQVLAANGNKPPAKTPDATLHAVAELAPPLRLGDSGCSLAGSYEAGAPLAPAASLAGWPGPMACGIPPVSMQPEQPLAPSVADLALAATGPEFPSEAEWNPPKLSLLSLPLEGTEPMAEIQSDRSPAPSARLPTPTMEAALPREFAAPSFTFMSQDEAGPAMAALDSRTARPGDAWTIGAMLAPVGGLGELPPVSVAAIAPSLLPLSPEVPDETLRIATVESNPPHAMEPAAVGQKGETAPRVNATKGAGGPALTPLAQVASMNSEQAAQAAWAQLMARMPELLAGHSPMVVQAEVGGRPFWRLRTDGFASLGDAQKFCSQVAAAGGGCWATLDSQ